jgi:hypothetical protein
MKRPIILVAALILSLSASADCNWGNGASTPQDVFNRSCRQQGGVPHGCSCDAPGTGGSSGSSGYGGSDPLVQGAGMIGNALGKALGDAIFGNPQQDTANQAAATKAAEQQRQADEQQRQAEEQRRAEELRRQEIAKQRILSQLKGSESSPGLALKTGDEDSPLTDIGTGTKAFGLGRSPSQDTSVLKLKLGDDADTIKSDSNATNVGGTGITRGQADHSASVNPGTHAEVSAPPAIKGLQLKLGDDAPSVSPGQTVALIPRQGDPEHLAKGGRYVDCDATRTVYIRIKKGMPVQLDWLNRTKARLDGELRERRDIDHDEKVYMVQTIFETSKDMALDMGAMKAGLSREKLVHLSPERQEQILKYAEKLSFAYDGLTKSPEAARAGFEFGTKEMEISRDSAERILSSADSRRNLIALQQRINEFAKSVSNFKQAMVDSGLAEEIGKEGSRYLGGPLGGLAFTAGKISLDITVMTGNDYLNEQQLQQAHSQYDNLKYLYDGLQETIANDHADLVQYCEFKG